MNAVTLKAHYDGKQICLDEPYELRPDAKLLVMVFGDAADTEREQWYALSQQSPARAYGEDEPDYSDLLDKKPASE